MMDPGEAPVLERFAIESRLGAGGFGVVYRAFDRKRNIPVALKALHPGDPSRLYWLKQEFRSLADINHPNLIALYELQAERDQWFLTMELIEGTNFMQYIRGARGEEASTSAVTMSLQMDTPSSSGSSESSRRPGEITNVEIDFDRLREAFGQLVRGVAALHDAGKLHRDIKPANVLVERGGRVVLLDFGLVTELAEQRGEFREVGGTPSYMAPEQTLGLAGTYSDWYAAGVMLYECITGRLPFPQGPRNAVSDPAPPSTWNPQTPEDLDKVCLGLLSYRPEARPGQAELLRLFPGGAAPATAPAEAPAVSSAFVGRARELASLHDAMAATRGGAVVVGLQGASGIGKSALLRQFLDEVRARNPDAAVLTGRCFDRETVPYKALDGLIDVLTQFLRKLPPREAKEYMPRDVSALARLFVVMRRVEAVAAARRRIVDPADTQELRRRAFGALRELLSRIAVARPVVLCVDDLQWGDLDSVPVIETILREPDAPPVLFLAVYRSGEADSNPALGALLPILERARDFRRIDLLGLEPPEARHLAEILRPAGADGALTESVAREAGGHPFLIDLLLRRHASGAGRQASLEDAIHQQVSELPERARALVELLAVGGRPLASALVSQAVDSSLDPALMRMLRSQRLVRSRVSGDREELETYHDRIRETVAARISPERLVEYHLRLAGAFAAQPEADAETVALHYHAAGQPELAAPYAETAAHHALDALAFDRAARLYRLALETQVFEADRRKLLHTRLGEALTNAGRGREAAEAYLRAAEGGGPAERINLLRLAAEQYLVSGHFDEGLETLRGVLRTVGMDIPKKPGQAVFSILWRRAYLRFRGLRFRVRPTERIPQEQLLKIDACSSAAFGLAPIDPIRGFDFQTRQMMYALKAGDLSRFARALAQDVSVLSSRGGRAWEHTNQVREMALLLAESTGDPQAQFLAASMSGLAFFFVGRWQEASGEFERAEKIRPGLSTRSGGETSTARIVSSICLSNTGNLNELARRFPDLLLEARDRGNLTSEIGLRTRVGYILNLAADDPERARREVREAIGRWSQERFHFQHFYALLAETETDLYAGDGASAWKRIQERWSALAGSAMFRVQLVFLEAHDLRVRAALALAAASPDRKRLLSLARADLRRMEREKMPWSHSVELVLQAGVAHLNGDRARAVELLSRGEAALDACGMKMHAAAARRRLGELTGDAAMRAAADQYLAGQGVRNPASMARMLAPGF